MKKTSIIRSNQQPQNEAKVVAVVIAWKVILFLIAWIYLQTFPGMKVETFRSMVHWPASMEPTWQSPFSTWDGAHYLKISVHGYQAGDMSCAFYPLWPFFIRTYGWLFGGDPFWTGLVFANVFSIVAILNLYKITTLLQTERLGIRVITLCIAFPGAIFLSLIYTEPLFLALTTSVFLLLLQKRFWLAASLAFFLPLTRPVGFLIIVPMAWECFRYSRTPGRDIWTLALPTCGYGLYFMTMTLWTGNPLEGFDAQHSYPTQPEVSKIWDIPAFLEAFFSVDEIHGMRGSLIDRLFFLLFLFILPGVFRIRTSFGFYVLLLGFISSISTHMISFSRHIVTCFPIMIALTQALVHLPGTYPYRGLLVILFAGQLFLWIRYLTCNWAG